MKAGIILVWTILLVLGIQLGLADPTAASLKRVIILEQSGIGFPPLINKREQEKLRLAQTTEPFLSGKFVERLSWFNE
jgi:hypothetical protein